MTPKIIVSYDDTANDHDALALGRVFASAGASVALAYVRHFPTPDPRRDEVEAHKAQALLDRGAEIIGVPDAERHVVINASTGDGLHELAEREDADLVVLGSEYRTARGAVQPGTSAQRLLRGGRAAVALAPAGLRSREDVTVGRIGVLAGVEDAASEQTAHSLADVLGATVAVEGDEKVDLLIVGSRPEAPSGLLTLSAAAEYAIDTSICPVLVVPRGTPVRFGTRALSAA